MLTLAVNKAMAPIIPNPKRIKGFRTEKAFETWLAANHAIETELWLKIHKKDSGMPTVTYAQALDVALCWGWIDAVRKGLDDRSYLQRYTPRGRKSIWSKINVDNVARLIDIGREEGTLGMDDLMKVLGGVEITPDRIIGIRAALAAEGIVDRRRPLPDHDVRERVHALGPVQRHRRHAVPHQILVRHEAAARPTSRALRLEKMAQPEQQRVGSRHVVTCRQ